MAFPDRQAAVALKPRHLTGRHRAPTGAPTRTYVQVGEEGTPSYAVAAHQAVLARRA